MSDSHVNVTKEVEDGKVQRCRDAGGALLF